MGKQGVGMPAALLLERFGEEVTAAFGGNAYQVGSSLSTTAWRDVDVRLMLSDEEYAAWGFGDPEHPHENPKWVAFTLAFSTLGKAMTGLPIDFQIQQQAHANAQHDGGRSALGLRRELACARLHVARRAALAAVESAPDPQRSRNANGATVEAAPLTPESEG